MSDTVLQPSPLWGMPRLPQLPQARTAGDPRRELMLGGIFIAGFFVLGVGWAAFTPLDAAVSASGTVKVSGERQKVQTMQQGMVSGLFVHEGSQVRAGQLLVQMSTAEASGNERSLAARVIGLQAEIARLEAEQLGEGEIHAPADFAKLDAADRALADRALALQRVELGARRSAAGAEQAVLRSRAAQIGQQINGFQVRSGATERQRALFAKELDAVRNLAAKGYASKNRVLQMERDAAELDGTAGTIGTEEARLRGAIGETKLSMVQAADTRAENIAQRLREAQTELQSALPQWAAARAQLARTQIRAPATGTVVGLAVHTVGGVAAPGETLMEVVPRDDALVVEARVRPQDANQIRPGQRARLHLAATHGRNIPEIDGEVTRVSADSFNDQRTGQFYYTMEVKVPTKELKRLSDAAGPAGKLRPGNETQVMVTLHERTALQYLIEPITQTFRGAMHEQ
ncbi:HlyD family type I secretion periplasmic adaptor subunit [Sphingomonas immobilis]|uniref:Membrane fusion protein (MFP) family protein n=1 Tax=Sphingomonas immobilis TaxID=3063997 RepID=A0ABT9A5W4_9SPHN|nr:HlyD family type I secretion periplasmic adaptor subunit [Sphingomonas sp. CA1-15]MDO7844625.1 HlyD family type I secretion periplasmic adaptor subunit [Sphingomonas sp. CA1-15]